MSDQAPDVAVVCPVYGNAGTLVALRDRLALALSDRSWVLRLVVDASPDDSAAVAADLAAADPRVRVTVLTVNQGQHRALARGLADEPRAGAWVCLDADLQDPPEAIPVLLTELQPAAVVFAGRRGAYESRVRLVTGGLHRRVLAALTGLPPDAGAFLAVDARGRDGLLRGMQDRQAPSVVAALGVARLPARSVPVQRDDRPAGRSAWTHRARLGQSVRTLGWAARHR